MTDTRKTTQPAKKPTEVTITRAKGRPMLCLLGKMPLGRVTAFPAQAVERFSAADAAQGQPSGDADWSPLRRTASSSGTNCRRSSNTKIPNSWLKKRRAIS